MNEDVKFITFHGMYDFAYLLKVLTNAPLPDDPGEFFETLHMHFPTLVDLKQLCRSVFSGGLQRLGQKYGVARIGTCHQGGSDALMTSDIFFAIPPELR